MKLTVMIFAALFTCVFASAQYVGVGTNNPVEKLDVNGNIKANGLTLNNGGARYDFLMKNSASGQVGFKKGYGAVGIHYIIALNGTFPSQTGTPVYDVTMAGEIKLFAGTYPPAGWAFCNGQLLSVTTYETLFILIGTTYGGNGQTNFALPDLRGATPVGPGIAPAGYEWMLGEKSDLP